MGRGAATAPRPWSSGEQRLADSPCHTPQKPDGSLALGKKATQMQAWGSRGGAQRGLEAFIPAHPRPLGVRGRRQRG